MSLGSSEGHVGRSRYLDRCDFDRDRGSGIAGVCAFQRDRRSPFGTGQNGALGCQSDTVGRYLCHFGCPVHSSGCIGRDMADGIDHSVDHSRSDSVVPMVR